MPPRLRSPLRRPRTPESSKIGVRGRTCLACRRVRGKSALVRLVRGSDGTARVDRTGTAPGRGAYLCPSDECFANGVRRIAGALKGAHVDRTALKTEFDAVLRGRRFEQSDAANDAALGDG